MVLLLLVCTISYVIGQPEECSSQRKTRSQCTGFAGNTDEANEAVSLLQVGAKRLQKTAAPPNSTDKLESLAQVAENVSVVSANSATKVPAPVVSPKDKVLSVLSYFQRSETRGSAFAIVVLVAIIGIAGLCLCGMVLQPETPRESWHAYPRASREVYETPVVRQGAYTKSVTHPFGGRSQQGGDSTRPSVRSLAGGPTFKSLPPQPYEGVAAGDLFRSGTETVLPRVSLSPSVKDSMQSLPRVKQAPGSSLSLTPQGSIMPKKDGAMQLGEPMAPELTGNAPPRRPVPICPASRNLVLPHCDLYFAVPLNQLVGGADSVEVLGLSQNPLLRVTIKDSSAGRVIEVSLSPPRSPAMASIAEAPGHGPRAGMMEIKVCSTGTHYGWLRSSKTVFGNSCHVLQAGGDDVMTVVTDAAHGSCHLYAGNNGDRLAQANRSGDGEDIFNPEDLEIRVYPGMDGVLALLCVLSIALFGYGDTAFTFPPSRRSA